MVDVLEFAPFGLRSYARLAAENLFLRKQLALYLERQVKPRRATNATRLTLVLLARFIEWRPVLTIVRPDTLVRWHRHAFRLLWRWKSRCRGRPRIPDLQQLIADMARANRTWGEERIAAELRLNMQQFRSCVTGDGPHHFVIHDRATIFSSALDGGLAAMALQVLKTPASTPQANAFCERLIGTIRRECLGCQIVLNERHVRRTVGEWVNHYNHGRPHASLGPGVPDPLRTHRYREAHRPRDSLRYRVTASAVLGDLHHEYGLERIAA